MFAANFSLPEVGQLFDSVIFTEEENVNREEADKLVEKYKKEARDLLPPPDKRFRDNRYSGQIKIYIYIILLALSPPLSHTHTDSFSQTMKMINLNWEL